MNGIGNVSVQGTPGLFKLILEAKHAVSSNLHLVYGRKTVCQLTLPSSRSKGEKHLDVSI